MQSVTVELKHCYGIASLSHKFDFSKKRQNVVHAANGIMKSSLALTFRDVAEGKLSSDRIHRDRPTHRQILDETGNELTPGSIFVVEPYNEAYKSNRMSTLLANSRLRERYDNVWSDIDAKKGALVAALATASGLKNGIEGTVRNSVCGVIIPPKEFSHAPAQTALHSGCPS
jgi:hypothetical protein